MGFIRNYICGFCPKTFVNGSNCRKHKLKDHPEELAAFEAIHGKGKGNFCNYLLNISLTDSCPFLQN